jgi:2-polyprenyl-3-methyl-5-hydroxy-6-metoxy-1,4-benzoquinol methylase
MKLLVCIASYGTQNEPHLHRLLQEYQSMPHEVDVVVLSNLPKKLGPKVQVKVGLPTKDPWSLPFGHKQIFADRVENYDLFIYSEDDHLITSDNLESYLKITSVLPENEIAGFIATETDKSGGHNFCGIHKQFHWDPFSVKIRGEYTFAHFTNEHTACYVLTQAQLKKVIRSGGFLVAPHDGKYDLPCTASTDPYTQCGFSKLVCISHLQDFMVKHLTNRYVGKEGIQDEDLNEQIQVLLAIGRGEIRPWELVKTETKLPASRWSKSYYETARADIVGLLPKNARSILSVGTGWGAEENQLNKLGFKVVAIPLDPVIAASAKVRGVEVLSGGLDQALNNLKVRNFDCVLLSNLLHLTEDPPKFLAKFSNLLTATSKVIAIVPNLTKLSVLWGRLKSDKRYRDMGTFTYTGVHTTSRRTVQSWFRDAGLKVERIVEVQSPEERITNRLATRLAGSLVASEFIVLGSAK